MKTTRRFLLGSIGALFAVTLGGGLWIARKRSSATVDPLLIDPDAGRFVYRDGWIVRI